MGAHMAKIRKVARQPSTTIRNVEKALDQKIISPRHPTTIKGYQEIVRSNPEFEKITTEKNEVLHGRLNSVRVDSTGMAPTQNLRSAPRIKKPNILPDGKLTYTKIDELFVNRKIAPDEWTDQKIAEHYKLDLRVTQNLMKYFGSFYIYKFPAKEESDLDKNKEALLQEEEKTKELT